LLCAGDGKQLIVKLNSKKMEKQKFRKRVAVALDYPTPGEALQLLDEKFKGKHLLVKLGMELVYASYLQYGLDIIQEIRDRGHEIFLDLKPCDIPDTVKNAMAVLKHLDVAIVNVHASGGIEMMREALKGLGTDEPRPLLFAVSVLTSIDKQCLNEQLLVDHTVEETVLTYARNAKEAGLDGVICSAWEAAVVRKALGEDFLILTPGIRFAESNRNDQKRVATPAYAREVGADIIVVGRIVTQAEDPVAAYEQVVSEFCGDSNEEE